MQCILRPKSLDARAGFDYPYAVALLHQIEAEPSL